MKPCRCIAPKTKEGDPKPTQGKYFSCFPMCEHISQSGMNPGIVWKPPGTSGLQKMVFSAECTALVQMPLKQSSTGLYFCQDFKCVCKCLLNEAVMDLKWPNDTMLCFWPFSEQVLSFMYFPGGFRCTA